MPEKYLSHNPGDEQQTGIATTEIIKVKKPDLYKVMLHNDDYTTMDFVVHVLCKHFGKDKAEAQSIMLEVHNKGIAVCGIYTYEVAETKVSTIIQEAEDKGFPLLCTMEPE